jgi:hypothetical protein
MADKLKTMQERVKAEIPLNDEKFGMLYGNHINIVGLPSTL